MKRGYPRPRIFVEGCETGDYGDSWNNKSYPVPYTAEEKIISNLNVPRLVECATFKKCIACGDPVAGEIVGVLRKGNRLLSESGPFHEKCAKLTMRMCPHIAAPGSSWTFSMEGWAEVKSDIRAQAGAYQS